MIFGVKQHFLEKVPESCIQNGKTPFSLYNSVEYSEYVLSIPLKSLWCEVCNKSRASFREILTKLNDVRYRFPEGSTSEYPDLQKALPLIIQKASGVQPKPPKKKLSYSLPLGTIEKYVSFEEVINPSKSKGLFFAIADNGNHFTKYGIQEGSLMVFDRECGQADDFPCCYIDETSKKMKLLRTAGETDQYVGRLVAVLRQHSTEKSARYRQV